MTDPLFKFIENIVKTTLYKTCNYIRKYICEKYGSNYISIMELKNYSMYPCINCVKYQNAVLLIKNLMKFMKK